MLLPLCPPSKPPAAPRHRPPVAGASRCRRHGSRLPRFRLRARNAKDAHQIVARFSGVTIPSPVDERKSDTVGTIRRLGEAPTLRRWPVAVSGWTSGTPAGASASWRSNSPLSTVIGALDLHPRVAVGMLRHAALMLEPDSSTRARAAASTTLAKTSLSRNPASPAAPASRAGGTVVAAGAAPMAVEKARDGPINIAAAEKLPALRAESHSRGPAARADTYSAPDILRRADKRTKPMPGATGISACPRAFITPCLPCPSRGRAHAGALHRPQQASISEASHPLPFTQGRT